MRIPEKTPDRAMTDLLYRVFLILQILGILHITSKIVYIFLKMITNKWGVHLVKE